MFHRNSHSNALNVRTLGVLLAYLCGALAPYALAQAQSFDVPARSVVVRFDDLDLNRPSAVVQLYRRIGNAAEQVCTNFEGRTLSEIVQHQRCVAAAVDAAVAEAHRAPLSAYYRQHAPAASRAATPVAGTITTAARTGS
jgi:UrcA family protein